MRRLPSPGCPTLKAEMGSSDDELGIRDLMARSNVRSSLSSVCELVDAPVEGGPAHAEVFGNLSGRCAGGAAFADTVGAALAFDLELHLRQRSHNSEDHCPHRRARVDVSVAKVQHAQGRAALLEFTGEVKNELGGAAESVQCRHHQVVPGLKCGKRGVRLRVGSCSPAGTVNTIRFSVPRPSFYRVETLGVHEVGSGPGWLVPVDDRGEWARRIRLNSSIVFLPTA